MGQEDRKPLDLKGLVSTLRHVTTAVQVVPFVYVALYILTLVSYNFISEDAQTLMDTLFYVSPVTVLAFLFLSRVLRLCKWHRRAVVLPLIPQVVSFLDYYIIDLSEVAVRVNFYVILSMSVLLLIAAYNVFIK